MKTLKILYWIPTGILSLMMTLSSLMYFFKTADVRQEFIKLGFPDYWVIPLAVLKIAAVVVILWHPAKKIVEWAYAGLAIDFMLAITAHIVVEGTPGGSIVAPIVLAASYILKDRVR